MVELNDELVLLHTEDLRLLTLDRSKGEYKLEFLRNTPGLLLFGLDKLFLLVLSEWKEETL